MWVSSEERAHHEAQEAAWRAAKMRLKEAREKRKLAARSLRRDPTPVQVHLWRILRGRRTGYKFRRATPIGGDIFDFYCAQLRLAIVVTATADISYTNDLGIRVVEMKASRAESFTIERMAAWLEAGAKT
jgi:hypothetical protein